MARLPYGQLCPYCASGDGCSRPGFRQPGLVAFGHRRDTQHFTLSLVDSVVLAGMSSIEGRCEDAIEPRVGLEGSDFVMRRQMTIGLVWVLWCLWGLARAAVSLPGPVIDGEWLKAHVDAPGLVVLDVQENAQYRQHHVPGAVNIPFTRWRSGAEEKPPLSLPPLKRLVSLLGSEGIDRKTSLIIMNTGTGPGDVAAVARVYWSLAVLGHERMAVLDGGLVDYVNRHHGAYVRGAPPNREPAMYRPRSKRQLLVTRDQLAGGLKRPLLDARSLPEYVGLVAGPGERPGTLPGARHLPFDWLVDDNGLLRDEAALDKLFTFAGIPRGGAIHFCHSGNRAALNWFADYALLGHRDARLYDGSMMEWSRDQNLLLERKLDL